MEYKRLTNSGTREAKQDATISEVCGRLSDYEDSGLSPKEAQELANAKADGRLMMLPCRPNDKLFDRNGRELIILCIEIGLNVLVRAVPLSGGVLNTYRPFDFGRTVFLTKKEAGKALGAIE